MAGLGRYNAAVVVAVSTLVAVLAGCAEPSQPSCRLDDQLTSSCGVVWGTTTDTPTLDSLKAAEEFAGRSYDLVYRFHDIDDQIPTDEERAIVDSGRALHLSIDARYFGGAERQVPWRSVAVGDFDRELEAQAKGVASLGRPVFVTFEHEMDQQNKEPQGSGPDFIAAWRHVRSVFDAAGADNAIWVWVAMGTEPALARAGSMWPGNDVVDWISWDVYNASGCRNGEVDQSRFVSFRDQMLVFHTWLMDRGPALGIDTSKPMMLSEVGSVLYPDDLEATAAWYQDIPQTLKKFPQIKAVALWDHKGNSVCDYRFTGVEALQDTIRSVGGADELGPVLLSEQRP